MNRPFIIGLMAIALGCEGPAEPPSNLAEQASAATGVTPSEDEPHTTCPDDTDTAETGECVGVPNGTACTPPPSSCGETTGVCLHRICLPGSSTACSDSLGCTEDACDEVAGCTNIPQPGFCVIEGVCVAETQADFDGDGVGDACDADADGDGDPADTDCDDLDSTRYHGAIEVCNSAVDYNCSGPGQAGTASLQYSMGSILSDQTVFASTYVVMGPPTGDGKFFGNILANSYITMGAGAWVTGDIQTGAHLTIGLSGTVDGSTLAVTYTTLGEHAEVYADVRSGAAVTLGANAQVGGLVEYGTAVTYGAGASAGSDAQNTTVPVIVDESQRVLDAQLALDSMTGGTAMPPGNLATDTTFTAGVYDIEGYLTVAAGVTITLDAEGQDSEFIFNIGSYLSVGAGVKVVVLNGTDNTRVIWNVSGGYLSLGANVDIVGTFLVKEYVVFGADSTLSSTGDYCGAVYSGTGYITFGAGAMVGDKD